MFVRTGPQSVRDEARRRSVANVSRFEARYEREGRSVTLQKEGNLTVDDDEMFLPSGITIEIPRRPTWDQTGAPLSDAEREEMIEDLIAGYAAMEDRLTLLDAEDVKKILYEAEPRAYMKPRKR